MLLDTTTSTDEEWELKWIYENILDGLYRDGEPRIRHKYQSSTRPKSDHVRASHRGGR